MDEREATIELKELFIIIKKRLGLIITIALLATILSAIVSVYFITPTYQATAQILISKDDSQVTISNQDVQMNQNLVNTYSEIIKSPYILDKVNAELNLNGDQKAIVNENITVNSVKSSQIISIIIKDPSQKNATLIANTIANTFKNEVENLMKINNVQVLTLAKENPNANPVNPNIPLNIAIAFVVSLMIGIGLAFLLEYLDNTLKTEQDIEKILELPVLGSVPQINEAKKKKSSRKMRPYEVTSPRERRA